MSFIRLIFALIALISPFTFTFGLIYAIREAVHGGDNDIKYGLIASVSLLIIAAACVLLTGF